MLGFHKDFLAVSHLDSQQEDTPVVCETKHKDRVLINQPKHAIFFLNILDSPPTEKNRKNLTQSEFSSLKASLSNEGFHSLADLLTHLNSGHTRICPEAYRAFLSELARNSPACGLLQLGCTGITEETKQILEHVSSKVISIQDSANSQQLAHLQAHASVITDFICKCPKFMAS